MNTEPLEISVVAPAYGCAECIAELHRRLTESLRLLTERYEIILVDDGSPSSDWEEISRLCKIDSQVRGIRLSRNYGQHFAITAGLDHTRGDWVVVMDCDLQDQPEEIPKLYRKALEGFDIVMARRQERQDSLVRRVLSSIFIASFNYLTDLRYEAGVANFSISSRPVIDAVCQLRECNRSFPVFLHEVGFLKTVCDVDHSSRFAGKSEYTLARLIKFAVQCMVSRSNKPLWIFIRFGFALAFLSLLYGCVILYRYFTYSSVVQGWTTLAVLMCFLGGLGFANLGVIGLYLGSVFDEAKKRPLYFVKTRLNEP